MGKGIDLARDVAPDHASVLDDFKDQLLIVLLKRLKARGDDLRIPVTEVDATGGDLVAFNVDGGSFNFELRRKQ